MVKHSQSTQNNKFAISFQYLKDNRKNKVDFLLADKDQRFLDTDTINLGVCGQAFPNYPTSQVCYLQYLKEEMSGEVDFSHADKHASFLQIVL